MRLLLFIGWMIPVVFRLALASMWDGWRPRAPWLWMSAARALVGPALATAALDERPLDAVRWARWTVRHAERAGGRAAGLGWQMDVALRTGIRGLVQTGNTAVAIDWATGHAERPVDAWHWILASVSKTHGPMQIPGLVVRARTSEAVAGDPGGSLGLMAVAVQAHRRQGRKEAAEAWRAEMMDAIEVATGSGGIEDWALGDLGRIAAVFDGEPAIQQVLQARLERSDSERTADSTEWYGLARGLVANGLVDGAMEAVRRGEQAAEARPLDPCGWLAPVVVGEHLIEVARWEECAEMGKVAVERAIRSELPTGVEASHVLLGRALFALGRHAEAREALERAIAVMDEPGERWTGIVFPDSGPRRTVVQAAGWYTLGRVHEALGSDRTEVDRMFERARRLASKHALLKGGTATDWILDGLAGR